MRRLQETINPVHFECNPKAARFYVIKHVGWCKGPSALTEDGAPSASLDHLKAPAAPTHPGAPPEPLGCSPWPLQPASGRSKDEECWPRATTSRSYSEDDVHKAIKYGVWASTDTGNRRLDTAYRELQGQGGRWKPPSALLDDTAPTASLDGRRLGTRLQLTPERRLGSEEARGGLRSSPQAAPKVEDLPPSTSRPGAGLPLLQRQRVGPIQRDGADGVGLGLHE